jgi:hypothetical protein
MHVLKQRLSRCIEQDNLAAWFAKKPNFGTARVEYHAIILAHSNIEDIVKSGRIGWVLKTVNIFGNFRQVLPRFHKLREGFDLGFEGYRHALAFYDCDCGLMEKRGEAIA